MRRIRVGVWLFWIAALAAAAALVYGWLPRFYSPVEPRGVAATTLLIWEQLPPASEYERNRYVRELHHWLDAFEDLHPGLTVDLALFDPGDDLAAALQGALEHGQPIPDIVSIDSPPLAEWPLAALGRTAGLSASYEPSLLQLAAPDGTLHVWPRWFVPDMWAASTRMLDLAGLSGEPYQTRGWSLADLEGVAKSSGLPSSRLFSVDEPASLFWRLLAVRGDALAAARDLVRLESMASSPGRFGSAVQSVLQGSSLAVPGVGTWPVVRATLPTRELALLPWPALDDGPPVTPGLMSAYVVLDLPHDDEVGTSRVVRQELAAALVRFLAEHGSARGAAVAGGVPAHLPARADWREESPWLDDRLQAALETAAQAAAYLPPAPDSGEWVELVHRLWQGAISPEDFAGQWPSRLTPESRPYTSR